MDQLSRTTHACVQGCAGSTSCSRRLGPGSEGPRCRPALPAASGQDPRALVVDQLSRATRACVLGQAWSTRCPGRLVLGSEGPRGRPAVTGHSVLGPSARGFDQESRETRARVRMPAVSTHFEGDLGPSRRVRGVDLPFGRIRPMPKGHGFDKHPGRLWTLLGAAVSNSCPRELALGPRAPVVAQHSLATRASVRGPEGSKSSPGRLALGFQGPRVRPDVFGDSGPVLRDGGVDQVPKATRPTLARLQGPEGWTSCPGPLALASKAPRVRPALTGHSGLCPRARRDSQLSRACRARVGLSAGLNSSPG